MRFGEQLRKLRKERNLLSQELASRASFSPATVSQIERGALIPTDETAGRLVEALEKVGTSLGDNIRQDLFDALKHERSLKECETRESLAFGTAFHKLLDRLSIPVAQFDIRPRSTINAWVTGTLLPSDRTLVSEILPKLKKAGADDREIRNLEIAHLKDLLTKSLKTEYLTETNRTEILSAALDTARRSLVVSQKEVRPNTSSLVEPPKLKTNRRYKSTFLKDDDQEEKDEN